MQEGKKSPLPCLVQERSSLGDDLGYGFYNSASTFFLMLRMNMERQKNNQGEPCGPCKLQPAFFPLYKGEVRAKKRERGYSKCVGIGRQAQFRLEWRKL